MSDLVRDRIAMGIAFGVNALIIADHSDSPMLSVFVLSVTAAVAWLAGDIHRMGEYIDIAARYSKLLRQAKERAHD